jgi:hypothetical protein
MNEPGDWADDLAEVLGVPGETGPYADDLREQAADRRGCFTAADLRVAYLTGLEAARLNTKDQSP